MVYGPAGQKAKYADFLTAAAAVPVPTTVTLKTADKFKIIGTTSTTHGRQGQDQRYRDLRHGRQAAGMKIASIEKPLQIGGKVVSFDATATLKYPACVK